MTTEREYQFLVVNAKAHSRHIPDFCFKYLSHEPKPFRLGKKEEWDVVKVIGGRSSKGLFRQVWDWFFSDDPETLS